MLVPQFFECHIHIFLGCPLIFKWTARIPSFEFLDIVNECDQIQSELMVYGPSLACRKCGASVLIRIANV